MTRSELTQEIHKHFAELAENGSSIKKIREIAPGIIVAEDALDNTFLYYFLTTTAKFRTDHEAQLRSANDQRGCPEGCSKKIMAFLCGLIRPERWDEVIGEAKWRLIGINGDEIGWLEEPRAVC